MFEWLKRTIADNKGDSEKPVCMTEAEAARERQAAPEGLHVFYQGTEERRALLAAFAAAGGRNIEFGGSAIPGFKAATTVSGIASVDLDRTQAAALQAKGVLLYPGRGLS